MVDRRGPLALGQLVVHLGAVFLHGVHLAGLLGKVAVQGRQLADADVDDLDLKDGFLAGQVLGVVVGGESDVQIELVPCLVADDALLKAGDHPAAAQLDGLLGGAAAGERLAVDVAGVVHVDDVALDGGALVGHQLGKAGAAALDHPLHLLVGGGGDGAADLKALGLAQLQGGLQSDGGGGHKAVLFLDADQVVAGLVHRGQVLLSQGLFIQAGDVPVHQVVDGVVPKDVLSSVGLDLGAVGLPFGKALDRKGIPRALIDSLGGLLQLCGRGAEGHFADVLFRRFYTYQFHVDVTLRAAPCGRDVVNLKLL